ncbi:hypothetical protein PBI_WAITS_85 [Gordonia phage Waits]|uniref:Uncharacterized protein n=1 Tax=Gordonia phage Waits TaxID=2108120 RepID=A0A2P1JSP1_9CAUD|nr:hypothetical protein FDJ48_gp025 [Gordonia phage Waits]AVO22112.1 hypothetical protein PBI_WAITS_85 [Gordonia phage Waits]
MDKTENQQIAEACDSLLDVLREVVPETTIDYRVQQVERWVGQLFEQAIHEGVKTSDHLG